MDFFNDPSGQFAALSAITLALVQVFKQTNILSDRFIPLLSLVIGTVLGLTFSLGFQSVFVGLVASGAYSGTRTVINK